MSGKNFDHRKRWLVTRIKQLSAQFAIDVCAYAVMSNHYHLVLHVNQDDASSWTDEEVIRRWTDLFPRNGALVETLLKNNSSKAVQKQLNLKVALWRKRLTDISWFMRCVNETVARNANREDQCSGRFWEGRFKSQALLDEKALVTCMAYVDLNPIRAGLAATIESSDFTSVQERLINHAKRVKNRSYSQHRLLTSKAAEHLVGHQSGPKQAKLIDLAEINKPSHSSASISSRSYLTLLEVTAQAISLGFSQQIEAKRVLDDHRNTLSEFGVNSDVWLSSVRDFHKYYSVAAGSEESLRKYHETRIQSGVDFKHPHKWIRGIKSARSIYGT